MNKLLLIFTLAVLFITGCATVPLADQEADKKSKNFSPPANKSFIYILRDSIGVPLESVKVNGKLVGALSNRTYFLLEVIPGEYKIAVGIADVRMYGSYYYEKFAFVDLLTEPGHMYFLRVEMPVTSVGPSAILTILPIDVGKEYILKYKRAKGSL